MAMVMVMEMMIIVMVMILILMMIIIKKFKIIKKKLIDDGILNKNSGEEFDNIINKWIQTKDKNVLYINNENKISTRKLDIYNIFYSNLKKDISYEDIKGFRNNINLAVKYYPDENK